MFTRTIQKNLYFIYVQISLYIMFTFTSQYQSRRVYVYDQNSLYICSEQFIYNVRNNNPEQFMYMLRTVYL